MATLFGKAELGQDLEQQTLLRRRQLQSPGGWSARKLAHPSRRMELGPL